MFLLRMMFWLAVVIMLIPTASDETPSARPDGKAVTVDGAIGAAAATVSDVAGFCDRNSAVCETGEAALDLFLVKAENAARLAYRMVSERRGGTAGETTGRDAVETRDAAYRRIGETTLEPADTLNAEDLEPAWRGPAGEEI